MEIKEIGEFGLIDLIKDATIVDESSVVVGIGDDAAVVRATPKMLQLMTTDMLVEGIHFDLSFTSPTQLGYKALAVNLSDIAAMGGVACQAVISIALPKDSKPEFMVELYQGMKKIAQQFKVNIVGGDTVASLGGVIINVAVLGEVLPQYLQRRSTAAIADIVVVTGDLGNAAAGLVCLQAGEKGASFSDILIQDHLLPMPQMEMAGYIAKYASSMNDISDGLASEASEIATASGVGLCIDATKVPLSQALRESSAVFGRNALDFALYGGEDYQLLFTITEQNYKKLCQHTLPNKLTVIGRVTDKEKCVELIQENRQIVNLKPKGYNHFI